MTTNKKPDGRKWTNAYAERRKSEGMSPYKRWVPPELFGKADQLLKKMIDEWRRKNGKV